MLRKDCYLSDFLLLAISDMTDKAICVAGIEPETLEWIRPVKQGYHCLFEEHVEWFPPNTILEVPFYAKQLRPLEEDPYGLHSEDEVINGPPTTVSKLTATQKRNILNKAADRNLKKALGTPGRSLFLVCVEDFRCSFKDETDLRVEFKGGNTTNTDLRKYLYSNVPHIGLSPKGLPCRVRGWLDFVRPLRRGLYLDYEDILRMDPNAEVFFALSLSGLLHGKHWLILAGIHIVGEEIWL